MAARKKKKPQVGPLGARSSQRVGFVVTRPDAALELRTPLDVQTGMLDAIRALAGTSGDGALWIVEGTIWLKSADTYDEDTGEPLALVDGSGAMESPSLVGRFDGAVVFDAWLAALMVAEPDASAASQTWARADIRQWSVLLEAHDGFRGTIAAQTVTELRTMPSGPDVVNASHAELFRRVRAGNVASVPALERAAVRKRDAMLWRYARAVRDGKKAIAAMYEGRIQL